MVGAFAFKVAYRTYLLSKKDEQACDCWVSGESNVDLHGPSQLSVWCKLHTKKKKKKINAVSLGF